MKLISLAFILWYFKMDLATAQSLPGRPTNIHVLADSFNIGVQWEPPTETFGTITNYIVSFRILPNTTEFVNIVSGQDNISIIAVGTHIGRLYKIRVRAQNDVGIGPYSDVRYIRINCSNTFDIYPNTSIELTSPGYDTNNSLEAGVMCSWTLHTDPAYVLEIQIVHMELTSDQVTSDPSNTCSRSSSYIDIGGIWRFCDLNYAEKTPKRSSLNNLNVTLKTGLNAGGRGFKMIVRSVIRLPGPPMNIHVSTTNHAIIVTWQQPMDNTLPVTSYVIRYNVINSNRLYRIPVSPNMRRFSLNVQKYEGLLLQLNISAAIGFEEGAQSRSFFIRAPCQHQIKVQQGQHLNITSPNYPQHYPKSIVCSWHVTSNPETEIYVTFLDFRLEDTSFCSNDYVLFSFKLNREPDCSRIRIPKTINTKTSAFNMTFVTDDQREFEGFLLQLYSRGTTDATDNSSETNLETTETTLTDVSKDVYDKPTQSSSSSNVFNIKQLTSMASTMSDIPESYVTGQTTSVYTKKGYHITTLRRYNDGDVIGQEATEQSTNMNKTITMKHPLYSKVTQPRVSERDRSDNNRVTSSVTVKQKLENSSSANNRVNSFVTLPSKSATLNSYTNTVRRTSRPTFTPPLTRKTPTSEENLETVTLVNDVRDVSEGLEANTTRVANMTGDVKEIGVGPGEFNMAGLIIGSMVSLLVLFVIVIGIYKWRKQKSKMKISYGASVRYKRGHVELHDIINMPGIRNQNNYDTFAVNNVQETSFINASGKRKSSMINTGTQKTVVNIGDTRKVVINDDGTGKQVKNDTGARKTGRTARKNHTCGITNCRPRRKHNSFPYSFGKRKVYQDIEKTLAAFKFIEDKEMLETQIRRKQCRQRTYSL